MYQYSSLTGIRYKSIKAKIHGLVNNDVFLKRHIDTHSKKANYAASGIPNEKKSDDVPY